MTDALGAQRLEAVESQLTGLKWKVDEMLLQVIGEAIGEAEQRSAAERKSSWTSTAARPTKIERAI